MVENIKVVRHLKEEEWRSFLEESPMGDIFHTPEMFQVYSRTKDFRPSIWAAVDNHNRPLALFLPVQITVLDGLMRRFSTRAVAYSSILCAPGAEGRKALPLLLEAYKHENRKAALFTELRNMSNLEEIQPILREKGFVYEDHLNYLIDLRRSPEEILDSFGRRTRKNIRRGLRQGSVQMEVVEDRKDISLCYNLLRQAYKFARVPLADQSLFESAFDLLYPKGMIMITVARVGHAPAAVSFELLHKGIIYGWYGGTDRAYSSHVPNELLMWHILKWGAEHGYQCYDFGGAGKPDENYGVRDFKAKFGGKLVNFGRNTYVHSPRLLALSKLGYSALRRFL
jgi:CelD/BcsL family acetyltransferase involved in cellulose biosynthesis